MTSVTPKHCGQARHSLLSTTGCNTRSSHCPLFRSGSVFVPGWQPPSAPGSPPPPGSWGREASSGCHSSLSVGSQDDSPRASAASKAAVRSALTPTKGPREEDPKAPDGVSLPQKWLRENERQAGPHPCPAGLLMNYLQRLHRQELWGQGGLTAVPDTQNCGCSWAERPLIGLSRPSGKREGGREREKHR